MKKVIYLILSLTLIACKNEKSSPKKAEDKPLEISKKNIPNNFDFENFKIKKGKLGNIKIGMTITEAEKFLNFLSKKEAEAYDFGFDGGGKSYIYSEGEKPILALVPKRDSEEILAIIAINENLKISNSLHPNSTVSEILKQYPNTKVNQNLMMQWEMMFDDNDDFEFVFMTDNSDQIGQYSEINQESIPKKLYKKADWITIK